MSWFVSLIFLYFRWSYKKVETMSCIYILCSGYGIAAQALTAVVKAHDGRGPQTMLTSSILDALGLSSPDELIGYFPVDVYGLFYDVDTWVGSQHFVCMLDCIADLCFGACSLMESLSLNDRYLFSIFLGNWFKMDTWTFGLMVRTRDPAFKGEVHIYFGGLEL